MTLPVAADFEPPRFLADLWEIVAEVWATSFLGYDVGDALIAILILLIGFGFRGLFSRLFTRYLMSYAKRTDTKLDDKLAQALYDPLKMLPIIVAVYAATRVLELHAAAGGVIDGDRIVQSLVVITLFWALHNGVEPIAHMLGPLRRALTPVMVDWLAKALRVLFVVVGAAAVLQVWGIPVAPVVAGLGLFGVAIGLGAQDLFKNLIAGILILAEKRFLPGEWVLVDGVVEGHVETINFRSTLVRRFDKAPVYVPNAFLADNAVTNFSRMTHRRIKWVIGVEYKTQTDQLKYIRDHVLDYVLNNDEFAHPPEVTTFMRVDGFGASSIDFMLYAFTKTTAWTEWLRIREELAFAIKRIVEEEAGTAFAFPSTTVYMDDGTEVFVPPRVQRHVHGAAAIAAQPRDAAGEGDAGEDGAR